MLQTQHGHLTPISEGYTAYGEIDQSEGRRGRRQLNSWTTLKEALVDCRGMGIQGDDGAVEHYRTYLAEGGLVVRRSMIIWDRRQDPETGYYTVGPVSTNQMLE